MSLFTESITYKKGRWWEIVGRKYFNSEILKDEDPEGIIDYSELVTERLVGKSGAGPKMVTKTGKIAIPDLSVFNAAKFKYLAIDFKFKSRLYSKFGEPCVCFDQEAYSDYREFARITKSDLRILFYVEELESVYSLDPINNKPKIEEPFRGETKIVSFFSLTSCNKQRKNVSKPHITDQMTLAEVEALANI